MTELRPDAPYRTPTRLHVDGAPLAVVRHGQVTLDEVEDLFDDDYSQLNAAATAGRIDLAGPSLAVYRGDPRGRFDVEIGMPVAGALTDDLIAAKGTAICGSALPDGTAVVVTYIGSYTGLGAAWSALARAAKGTPSGTWAEVYVTEPGLVPVERLRTDLFLYVAD